MDKSERAYRVSPIVLRADYEFEGNAATGYITNLSRTGAFLTTGADFEVGDELTIRLLLPSQLGEVKVRATVVWRTRDLEDKASDLRRGLGLKFISPPADVVEKLQAYTDTFRRRTGTLENTG